MKPPIATLRLGGHIIATYIDDLINVGLTFDECVKNVIASIKLLNSLGFVIHSTIHVLNKIGNKISGEHKFITSCLSRPRFERHFSHHRAT